MNNNNDDNNDNNFSIKIEAIVRTVGNLRIKEALLIAKLYPQIYTRLELSIEYINNQRAHSFNTYLY